MTANQWRMLELLDRYDGHGTIEIEMQWGDYSKDDTEAEEAKGWRTCRLVVSGLFRSLVARGYAAEGEYRSYGITDTGRVILEKHRARLVKTKEANRP